MKLHAICAVVLSWYAVACTANPGPNGGETGSDGGTAPDAVSHDAVVHMDGPTPDRDIVPDDVAMTDGRVADSAGNPGDSAVDGGAGDSAPDVAITSGWTVFTPVTGTGSCGDSSGNYTGTCVVFVAASGNDSTCAAQLPSVTSPSAGQACATIAHGISLLRRGASADWLLLNRGDTFQDQDFSTFCAQSGTSPTSPLLISAYGSGDRPIVEPSSGASFAIGSAGGGGCAPGGNNIALVSIEIYDYTADPSNPHFVGGNAFSGTVFLNQISWMLIEDCMFEFASVVIEPTMGSNVTLRRNEILDAYNSIGGHSSGVYIDNISNLVIQENVVDHNGLNSTVPGGGSTIFNHNLYLQCEGAGNCNGPIPPTVVGNIISRGADGDQYRSGGTITDNAYIQEPYGFGIFQPIPFQSLVNNNVHIEATVDDTNGGTGNTTDAINTSQTADLGMMTLSGNIIAHGSPGVGGIFIDSSEVGTVIQNNILCDWAQDSGMPLIWDQSGVSTLTSNYQNPADCDHNNYPSPDLTVGTYDMSLGTGSCGGNAVGTTDNFLCKARQQSKTNWSDALMAHAFNNYIRAGFGE